jgi:protein-tyrosine phosphatase
MLYFSWSKFQNVHEQEIRQRRLSERREKLRDLLQREEEQFRRELANIPPTDGKARSLEDLRLAREAMRRKKEEEQKKVLVNTDVIPSL